jgi:hypothetical protein
VKVASGYKVQLFGDINYGGNSLTLTADNANLVPLNFNDVASSFKISNGTTGGTWNKKTTFTMVNNTRAPTAMRRCTGPSSASTGRPASSCTSTPTARWCRCRRATTARSPRTARRTTNYFHSLAQARSVTIAPINSARLMLSVGSRCSSRSTRTPNGNIGYAGANIENPTDPNIDVTFDFIEMAIVPTTASTATRRESINSASP